MKAHPYLWALGQEKAANNWPHYLFIPQTTEEACLTSRISLDDWEVIQLDYRIGCLHGFRPMRDPMERGMYLCFFALFFGGEEIV